LIFADESRRTDWELFLWSMLRADFDLDVLCGAVV